MQTEIIKIKSKTTPLCILPNGNVVCYSKGQIEILRNGLVERCFPFPVGKLEKFLGWSNLAFRLMRMGVRSAIALNNEIIILSVGNMIYEMNISEGSISRGWFCGIGIRPLVFTSVKGINSFDEGVYFGGYLGNKEKKPVCIYHRIGVDQWETVYSFPQGAINHVHNIVPDPYRDCLWVFTGDFDEASAIWKITKNFSIVERVVSNDQKYRACVIYALPEGLLYATDAPFANDFIYLLKPETMELTEVLPIHGSCIYGCKWKDKYVFSSTVEGDGRDMNHWEFLFMRKRGAGIKDNFVHMYMGNMNEGFVEVYKEKKDIMPFYTFQFGVFKFPDGVNDSNTLLFQPVATTKNDLALMSINRTGLQ